MFVLCPIMIQKLFARFASNLEYQGNGLGTFKVSVKTGFIKLVNQEATFLQYHKK